MSTWLREPGSAAVLDLRLVPAAVAAWVCGLGAASTSVVLVRVLVGAGVAALLAAALVRGRRFGRRPVAAGLVLLGVTLVGSGLIGSLRQEQRLDSPLSRAADRSQFVLLEGELRSDPRPLASGPGGARVLVELDVVCARIGGVSYRLDRPVVLLAPAAGWTDLLPGQLVRVAGRAMPSLGGHEDAAVSGRGPPVVLSDPDRLQRAAAVVRAGLTTSAHRALDPPADGLLVALVDGDTTGVDPVVSAEFTAMGLTHLLAVSGANCAIVSGSVLWLARRARLPFAVQIGLTAVALVAFVVVARPSPSVLRAAAMGAVTLVAMASGRPRAAVPALAGSVLVLLTIAPSLATSAGFALSVLATAGIVVLGPPWAAWLGRVLPAPLALAVAVAAAAGVATAPVLVLLQPVVNLASVPANLLAAPAVPIATVLGVGAAVLAPWWPDAADLLCWSAGFAVRWVVLVAHEGSRLPESTLRWPAGPIGAALLVGVIAAAYGAVRLTRSRPALRVVAAGLVVGVVVVGIPVRAAIRGWPPSDWLMVMCDVGQGDALAVRVGPGAAVVVDTGPDPVAVDRCLRELGVTEVPLLVITHLHLDHVGGLAGVLGRRPIGEIDASIGGATSAAVARLQAAAGRYGVPVRAPALGERRTFGPASIEVVGPLQVQRNTDSDLNNNSLILRVLVGGVSILLTGDAEVEEQTEYLRTPGLLDVDVLKVPHHGSAYQRAEFLRDTTASVALVSVGAGNDYGHPSPLTMAELRSLGMKVYRTDLSGDVAVVLDDAGRLAVVVHPTTPATGRRG